jgi:H+/Na+-translocating ferredoxin:NAD+ oxidoreductase subunit G
VLVLRPASAAAQEGVFLRAEDAPGHLFPDGTDVRDRTVPATEDLRRRVRDILGRPPSTWEEVYRVSAISRGGRPLGFVVVVEEIGKHRPITFAVAVNLDGTLHDLAVLAYREAYGGEIRARRFLGQYAGKTIGDALLPFRDVRNIAGATLSVQATGRAARKAIAVLKALGELG